MLYQPLLQTSTKGKSKIKEVHTSPGRSLGTTTVAQTDAGLYIKDKISQTKFYEVHKEQETEAWGDAQGKQQMERQLERSGTDEGLVFGAPSRLLSSIPDRVAGQESQFAEFPQKCLPRLSTDEREYLGNVSDIFRCNEPTKKFMTKCYWQTVFEKLAVLREYWTPNDMKFHHIVEFKLNQ